MNDSRTKVAAFAILMGLGGLGGYALSAEQAARTSSAEDAKTQVVRRTVHVKPKGGAAAGGGPLSTATSGSESSFASTPVGTGTSGGGKGGSGHRPVGSGTSGGGASGGGGYEDEGEHEREFEGGDD